MWPALLGSLFVSGKLDMSEPCETYVFLGLIWKDSKSVSPSPPDLHH